MTNERVDDLIVAMVAAGITEPRELILGLRYFVPESQIRPAIWRTINTHRLRLSADLRLTKVEDR